MPVRALVVAVGNALRGDDGVAQRALALLPARPGVGRRAVVQLVPELAAELAGVDAVVFVDADVRAARVCVEPVATTAARAGPLGHACAPAEVVALARALYGFDGRALLCRVPAAALGVGPGLTDRAERAAAAAAAAIAAALDALTSAPTSAHLTSPPPPTPSTPPRPAPR